MASTSIFQEQYVWASVKMQPIAIRQCYSKLWPDATVIELDRGALGGLDKMLDFAGADKMLRFGDGRVSFLAQRFRKAEQAAKGYDDLTLRDTEWEKVQKSYESNGHISGFYAYGVATEDETSFQRIRIVDFRKFVEWAKTQRTPRPIPNKDGRNGFHAWPFSRIPSECILHYLVQVATPQPEPAPVVVIQESVDDGPRQLGLAF